MFAESLAESHFDLLFSLQQFNAYDGFTNKDNKTGSMPDHDQLQWERTMHENKESTPRVHNRRI